MSEISEEQDHQQCDPVLHVDQTGDSAGGVFNLTLMNSTFSRLVPCSEELIRWRGCFVPPETTKTHLKKRTKISRLQMETMNRYTTQKNSFKL